MSNNDAMLDVLVELRELLKDVLYELSKDSRPLVKAEEPEKPLDMLQTIRKAAQNIIMEGREEDLRKLFNAYSIKKLSELTGDKYEEFLGELIKI